jgi:hypothetical protein
MKAKIDWKYALVKKVGFYNEDKIGKFKNKYAYSDFYIIDFGNGDVYGVEPSRIIKTFKTKQQALNYIRKKENA